MSNTFLKDFDTTVRAFNAKAKKLELNAQGFLNQHLSYELKIDNQKSSVSINSILPENIKIDAILLRLRPFYLQQEPLFFPKVCNIVNQNCDEKIIIKSNEWRESWHKIKDTHFKLVLNEEKVDTFDLWLYGEYYHVDVKQQKAQKLSYIKGTPVENLTQFYFYIALQKYITCILAYNEQIIKKLIVL